jgi:hypothetical protein
VLWDFAMRAFGLHGFAGSLLMVFLGYLIIQFVIGLRRRTI